MLDSVATESDTVMGHHGNACQCWLIMRIVATAAPLMGRVWQMFGNIGKKFGEVIFEMDQSTTKHYVVPLNFRSHRRRARKHFSELMSQSTIKWPHDDHTTLTTRGLDYTDRNGDSL